MPRSLQLAFSLVVVTLLVGGPLWYKREHERHFRKFRVMHEGVLYRSAQLDLDGLKRLVHDYGIKTIISLRDGDAVDDQQEAEWAARVSVNHVRIPPRSWSSGPDGIVPATEGLAAFRKVIDDPANHPVLIHCFAGIHRTGTYCAVYRMDYQKWSNSQAIAELKSLGYATLDDDLDVLSFLELYRPRSKVPTADQVHSAPSYFPHPALRLPPELEALERDAAEQPGKPLRRQIVPAP